MSTSELTVSILMPTKNRLAWFKEALGSARAQRHAPLEILVSDDGSSDGTLEWVREVASEDSRVRLAPPNPRPGLFENLNHLAAQATGDALFFLADDDRLMPDGIETLVAALKRHPEAKAANGEWWIIDGEGRRDEGWTERRIHGFGRSHLPPGIWDGALAAALRTQVNIGGSMFRRGAVVPFVFDTSCEGAADVELWIRVAEKHQVVHVPEKVAELRLHPEQASAHKQEYMARGIIRALELHPQSEPELERARLEPLQRNRAGLAILRSTTDRRGALRSAASYLKDALRFRELRGLAKVGYATTLVIVPRDVAKLARRTVSGALRWLRRGKNPRE